MVAMNAKEREGDWEALIQKADPRFKYFLGSEKTQRLTNVYN